MGNNRRCWAEIDLGVLAENFRHIYEKLKPGVRLLAVVKANGYGHGAIQVAETALANGASYLATATIDEALELRHAGIMAPILVLGYVDPSRFTEAVMESVTLAVFDEETARALSDTAVSLHKTADLHIKIDTGMGRIGFQVEEEAADTVKRISTLPNLYIEGLFTHFALADGADKAYTYRQFEQYMRFVSLLEARGITVPLKHCANSAAIMELPGMQLDMVRSGIINYGLYPSDEVDRSRLAITPVMRFKARITHIKTLGAGHSISYGCTYTTEEPRVIATVSAGYADGYSRLLSNRGTVVVRGKKALVAGRVCMDQFMVDVTGIPDAQVGDEVILFGTEADGVTAEEVANLMQTIHYEVVCLITDRVERVFTGGPKD